MTITFLIYVGIDVSEDTLEVARLGKKPTEQFAKTKPGIAKLVRHLKQGKPKPIVVEATGGYEEAVVVALFKADLPALVSPQRVRQYSRAKGLLAKTDQLDACQDRGGMSRNHRFKMSTFQRHRCPVGFVKLLLNGKFPPLADPDIARDFIFTEDVVQAYLSITASAASLTPGEVFNVGTGRQTTIRDVIKIAKDVLNFKTEPV